MGWNVLEVIIFLRASLIIVSYYCYNKLINIYNEKDFISKTDFNTFKILLNRQLSFYRVIALVPSIALIRDFIKIRKRKKFVLDIELKDLKEERDRLDGTNNSR